MSFFSGSSKHRSLICFEISSASVGISFATVDEDIVTVLWTHREPFALHKELDYDKFVRTMLATLLEACMNASGDGARAAAAHPSFDIKNATCHCVLGPPWFLSTHRVTTVKQETPFAVTDSMLEGLVKKDEEAVLSTIDKVKVNQVMRQTQPVETLITDIRLNGYSVRHHIGKQAQELFLATYFSVTSPEVAEQIEDVIHKVFANHKVDFHSSTLTHYRSLTQSTQNLRNTCLVEVGGEITALSTIRNGVLLQSMTFPQGTNHILRALDPQARSRVEAMSLLKRMKGGSADETQDAAQRKKLTDAVSDWRHQFANAMQVLAQGEPWPRTMYLVANAEWHAVFLKPLHEYWNHPSLGTMEPIRFFPLLPKMFAHRVKAPKNDPVEERMMLIVTGIALDKHLLLSHYTL